MIKKITSFLLLLYLIITSCTTDIEINTPALQAKINGEDFRTITKKAIIYDDGTLVIKGNVGDKSISFTTSAAKVGIYKIGQQTMSRVSFQKSQRKFISKEGDTEGTTIITEIYDNQISGTFSIKSLKDEFDNTMNFNDGWFYRLPIENGITEEVVVREINTCLLNASLTALVNGNELITYDHSAEVFGIDDVSILITASNGLEKIEIVFPANAAPGQYSLSGSGDYSASYIINNDKSSALSGNLIVIEHNTQTKCISGNFEFETRSGSQITKGIFEFGY